MLIPKKQNNWKVWLVIGIFLTIIGFFYPLRNTFIPAPFILAILFFGFSYSSYNFSRRKVVKIGKNLTIFFLIISIIFMFLGYYGISGEFISYVILFAIYWFFENRKIKKLKK
ncbi:MAG: hypothetical protein Q8P79_01845 [Nanoarchaeota archaeon]|nr:hypothetical protein [Nanoarchaeota archaeon]